MKRINMLRLAIVAALGFMAGSVQAVGNTGTGGVITYTDSNGSNAVANPPYIGGYVVHTFTNSDTLTIPAGFTVTNASVLVVAGGGGGGNNGGGGGGAGGLIYTNNFGVTSGSGHTVTVGVGGLSGDPSGNGSDSVFSTLTAKGGGGGGSRSADAAGHAGGSGGGGSSSPAAGGTGTGGQGYNGGTGKNSSPYGGGGGGGAGGAGATSMGPGGNGGNGVAYSITGSSVTYGGGGGGGNAQGGTPGAGGSGGGGTGGNTTGITATSGTANTGGGCGGGGGATGTGGSGIVIVRYPYDAGTLSVTVTEPANGRQILPGSSVTATVSVASGQSPYTVTFYTNSVLAWSTNNASTNLFTIDLGTLANGTYEIYASVTDSAGTPATATSATNTFTVAPDTTPPTPNPMTFAVNPAARDTTSIIMTATTATDALTPPVEYYFENTTNSNNSGWITSTVWTNTGLTVGTTYGYRVKARDSATTPNETSFSDVLSAAPANRTLYWDGGTADIGTDGNGASTGGNGTWNTTIRNWDAGAAPHVSWIAGDSAIFGGTAGTVTLGEPISVSNISFTAAVAYTISGGTLNFGAGGLIRTADNRYDQTITSAITGSPEVRTKDNGAGDGYLGLKFAPTNGTVTLGAVLNPDNTGSTDKAGVTFAGTTTGNTVASINYAGGDRYGDVKVQSGEWTVNGMIRTGTVKLSGGKLFANGTVDTDYQNFVFTGGTLAGTGTVNDAVSVPVTAGLAPGNPTGMMTITGACTINGKLEININGSQVGKLAIAPAQTLTLGASAVLDVNVTGTPISPVTIATYGSGKRSGTFASNDLPNGWTINYGATAIVLTPPAAGTLIMFF